jgi:lysophospholipid hydrolase
MSAEVGPGGTLSSLFTILGLFTEDVHLSWQGHEDAPDASADAVPVTAVSDPQPGPLNALVTVPRLRRRNSEMSDLELETDAPPRRTPRREASTSSVATLQAGLFAPRAEPLERSTSASSRGPPLTASPAPQELEEEHGIVARATEDSTLAVIPGKESSDSTTTSC